MTLETLLVNSAHLTGLTHKYFFSPCRKIIQVTINFDTKQSHYSNFTFATSKENPGKMMQPA